MNKRGLFIVIEGLDRCGKSTQLDLFSKKYSNFVEMNFPDRETDIGKSINAYLKSESELSDQSIHLLFSANRWEKHSKIMNLLNSGKSIICGRYSHSGVAYSNAKGMNLEWCINPDKGLISPDIIFYLDINVEEASKRSNYGDEKYEKLQFQKKVQDSFNQILKGENVFKIDATLKIEQVHEKICKIYEEIKEKEDLPIKFL
eukprot:gene1581-12706_t